MNLISFIALFFQLFAAFGSKINNRKRRNIPGDLLDEILFHVAESNSNTFETKGVEVICLRKNMCIAISSRFYQKEGLQPVNWNSMRLNGPCPNAVISDMIPGARTLCTKNGFLTCGTNMIINSTHVIFRNALYANEIDDFSYPNVVIGRYNEQMMPWECTYPLDYLVSLSSASLRENFYYKPYTSEIRQIIVELGVSGTGIGKFHVGMFLYNNSEYQEVLAEPPTFNMSSTLYVGLSLLDGPLETVIEVESCWGTPTPDSNDERKFILIDNYCPNYNFVVFREERMSRYFHWQSSVFRFKNSSSVYLHCRVKICFYEHQICNQRDNCSKVAQTRRKRSTFFENPDEVLSIGPLKVSEKVRLVDDDFKIVENFEKNKKSKENMTWMMVFKLLLLLTASSLFAVVVTIYRRLTSSRKTR